MSDPIDSTLVDQALGGNLKSFEALVEKYQKPVFNLALRVVQDPDEAEDVAQATFVKAFEHLKSYNERFKFYSWLYRIAMNESLSVLRHRKQLARVEETEDFPEDSPDPMETVDTASKIQAALLTLTDDQRAVVTLKHLEGFSYIEIAEILAISEKKVKSRLFSARQALRDVLMKNGFGLP